MPGVRIGHLERVFGVVYAPKVARGLSPGFNPGDRPIKRFALMLKGREERAIEPYYNYILLSYGSYVRS
jgi:hypothetical protein